MSNTKQTPTFAVGIDLGTTFSCVAIYRNKAVEIIASEIGERTTPSYVAFSDEGLLIGQAAKNQAVENAHNTVFDAKRLIGRSFDEPTVQADKLYWPFEVISKENKPVICVDWNGKRIERTPEQISALVLGKMKLIAEEYLGGKVTQAVITVPAYFNDSQRQATKDAGFLAGLEVLRVTNEPTAAAIAYGLGMGDIQAIHSEKNDSSTLDPNTPLPVTATTDSDVEKKVLVFDLGGGTFDVSLLLIEGSFFEVLATAGDTHLGGEDFDALLINHFLSDFLKRNRAQLNELFAEQSPELVDESAKINHLTKMIGPRAMRRLRTACERAKRVLSSMHSASIEIEDFFQSLTLSSTLSRARFETLCGPFFANCLEPVKKVLQDKKLKVSDIDDIVLVGGSTRIPKIRELLQQFFGKPINTSINPDEAVAFGAAVQAQILSGNLNNGVSDGEKGKDDSSSNESNASADADEDEDNGPLVTLVDVAPLSLGIEAAGNVMSVFLKRNTSIPKEVTKFFSTDHDGQTEVEIRVFEGERPCTLDNHFLGNVILTGIPPGQPAGVPRIKISLSLDQNGLLSVSAIEEVSKIKCKTQITSGVSASRLSHDDLKRLLGEAEEFALADQNFRRTRRQLMELKTFCDQVQGAIAVLSKASVLNEVSELQILSSLDDTMAWLDVNASTIGYEDCRAKKERFMKKMDSLLAPAFELYIAQGGDPYPNGKVDGVGIDSSSSLQKQKLKEQEHDENGSQSDPTNLH